MNIKITLAKVRSASIEQGKRILKVLEFGTKTAKEASPFGFDSCPVYNDSAIYLETSNASESVIVGYINKNQISLPGESRMYSKNEAGEIQGFVYNRIDGKLGLNGFDYSAVRFQNMKAAIDAKDALVNTELAKIATAITSLGGTYTPVEISTNLDSSESESVKVK